ncbi:MAG: M23 family metallopeptidase, partial [Clostridia bacterium]|nr:M23 family metallopeptidase [Clostridia bacterium]
TTVTIDHGKGLKTVYNSIEPIEGLASGQKVEKGQVIGKVSTNNKQEYKDGPHLHFEVWENGESISPLKYLTVEEK